MTARTIVLLDTNHLSELARSPAGEGAELLRRLQANEVAVAISLFMLLELADPAFASIDSMRGFLRDILHVLANPFEDVQDEEIACACARAAGLNRRPPRVFARDTSEWGHMPGPIGGSAVDLLDAWLMMPEQRREVYDMAVWGANASMMKKNAAVIRAPLLPITVAVHDHIQGFRRHNPTYADGLTADEVVSAAGGVSGFPGYHVQEGLASQRMRDVGQKSTRNDVFDEFTAFYAPYASAAAVDGPTYHRARMASLPCVERMTNRLGQVPRILDRVRSGELVPVGSAGW